MSPDFFLEETPGDLILVSDHLLLAITKFLQLG